jgi:hypothetical protein
LVKGLRAHLVVKSVPNFFLRWLGLVPLGECATDAGVRVRDLVDALRPETRALDEADALPDLLVVDAIAP